ncbi:MAG: hypothetical protein JXR96_18965 [Deltaproteobacteria bacterium]|nr:hypothetical protein [Deltaproteobacteria bacterium]
MRWNTPILGLVLVLGAPAARAAEATPQLVEQAAKSYAELDFEASLGLLDRALAKPGNTREQLVRIHHLRGLILGALGRYDEAGQAFARLLALSPSFRLGSDVAPRVRAPFDKLLSDPPRFRARVLPPAVALESQALVFTVQITADSLGMARALRIFHRRGAGDYSSANAPLSGRGEVRVSIPPQAWQGGAGASGPLAWYGQVLDEKQAQIEIFGDAMHPLLVDVSAAEQVGAAPAASEAWYEKWWVWTIVGGVVAAGTATAVVLGTRGSGGPHDFEVVFE